MNKQQIQKTLNTILFQRIFSNSVEFYFLKIWFYVPISISESLLLSHICAFKRQTNVRILYIITAFRTKKSLELLRSCSGILFVCQFANHKSELKSTLRKNAFVTGHCCFNETVEWANNQRKKLHVDAL